VKDQSMLKIDDSDGAQISKKDHRDDCRDFWGREEPDQQA